MNLSAPHSLLLRRLSALAFSLGLAGTAQAQSFDEAVLAARKADPQFAAQQAGVQGQRVLARQAGAAFYPYANAAYNRADAAYSGKSTRSLSVSQPLFSYDRLLTLRQSDPLSALAEAQERQSNADMVLRVYTAMADILRQRESIRAITVQINGLDEQLRRAVRMRELGQGTVTEVSDFEVRVAVAQANRVSLQNTQQTAERSFGLLTGLRANVPALAVELVRPWQDARGVQELADYVRTSGATTVSAQRNLELAEIAAKRVKAQFLPQVSGQAGWSGIAGSPNAHNSTISVTLTAPLGVSPFYDNQKAVTEVTRAQENLRFAQESAVSEVTRLFEARISYRAEVTIRERALQSAKLAVEGNEKSYLGGVKTNIDVLTSYQNLADAEVSLVNSRLARGDAELRLQLLLDAFTPAL
jgi:protease secretion system outer membrane protein